MKKSDLLGSATGVANEPSLPSGLSKLEVDAKGLPVDLFKGQPSLVDAVQKTLLHEATANPTALRHAVQKSMPWVPPPMPRKEAREVGHRRRNKLRRVMPDDQLELKGGERFVVKKKHILHDLIMKEDASPGKAIRLLQKQTGQKPEVDAWPLFTKLFHRMAVNTRLAHKFVLDDDALRTVCAAASTNDAHRIEGMLMAARLPFEKMWVEYDLGVRNDIYEKQGTLLPRDPQYEAMCGFLLQRVRPDDPTEWTAQFVIETEYGVDFAGAGYLFRTEGAPLPIPVQDIDRNGPLDYHDMGLIGAMASDKETAMTLHGIPWGLTVDQEASVVAASPRMHDSVRVLMPAIPYVFSADQDRNARRMVDAVYEGRGDARFLVALLSLINRVPIRYSSRSNVPGNRLIGTRVVKYFQHSTITLDLDGHEAVREVHNWRKLGYDRKSPINHPVRGHWMRWRGTGRATCRHVPWPAADQREELTAGYILCEKCQALLTWKDHSRRGDAGRGFKETDYAVTDSR